MFRPLHALLSASVIAVAICCTPAVADDFATTGATVGHAGGGVMVTPVNQVVTPAGKVVELPGMRAQAVAMSPNGKILVVAGLANRISVIDPGAGEVLQNVRMPDSVTEAVPSAAQRNLNPNRRSTMSMGGLAFSPDGSRIYLSGVFGDIKVFGVSKEGKVSPLRAFALPPANAPERVEEIPTGIAVSADGKRIYVALSLSNRVGEFDAETGRVLRLWETGVAPCEVVLVRDRLYVSNWGGRRPGPPAAGNSKSQNPKFQKKPKSQIPNSKETVGPAGKGMMVRVDERGIASEGSVSVVEVGNPPGGGKSQITNPKSQKNSKSQIPNSKEMERGGAARGEDGGGIGKVDTGATEGASPPAAGNSTSRNPKSQKVEGEVAGGAEGESPALPRVLAAQGEILVGRHASAMGVSPDGRWVVVAATSDDMFYVIDTRSGEIAEKFSARKNPGDLFGAQPVALAFSADGKTLYAANGTQNAIGVFRFDPADKESAFLGLIPTGWFPNGVVFDARRGQLCVSNMKDIVAEAEVSGDQAGGAGAKATGFRTRQFAGTVSLIPLPTGAGELAKHTARALGNLRYPLLAQAALPARKGRAPAPVPERAGEPSVFKHVIYIIKENRTYDQVLGDMKSGRGDPSLCIYGEDVTPNQHKIAREFVLLDNTYCSGAMSADGHNWSDSGIAIGYVERQSAAGYPRSYPSGGGPPYADALAYAPTGFIWDNALKHGKSVINFGEHCTPNPHRWKDAARKDAIGFLEHYKNYVTGADAIVYGCEPDIEAMRPICDLTYMSCDWPVPDQVRASHFIRALKEYEKNDNLPALVILWLPNDHTAGTKPGMPAPEAMMADNDLAMGRVIEALSHTKFWKDTCVLAIEDDSQNGWDHVSGYRTTAYVVSAYTKRGATVSTQYNHTSLLRTIELILGLPPMNQMDATATPMFDCFTTTPDFTPFKAVPNRVPLDKMNPDLQRIRNAKQRADAAASAKLPLDKADQCDEDVFNRILWRAAKGYAVAYPEWAVKVAGDED